MSDDVIPTTVRRSIQTVEETPQWASKRDINVLLDGLNDDYFRTRGTCADALRVVVQSNSSCAAYAAEGLLDMVSNQSPETRSLAAKCLFFAIDEGDWFTGSELSVSGTVQSNLWAVHETIVGAGGVEVLLRALDDEEALVRRYAARILGRIGQREPEAVSEHRGVEILTANLRDETSIATALERIGHRRPDLLVQAGSIDVLVSQVYDGSNAAASALETIGNTDPNAVIGAGGVDALFSALYGDRPVPSRSALITLGRHAPTDFAAAGGFHRLNDLLSNKESCIRSEAAAVLKGVAEGDSSVVYDTCFESVRTAIDDDRPEIRATSIRIAGVLVGHLSSETGSVPNMIAKSGVLDQIFDSFDSSNSSVRSAAAFALGEIGTRMPDRAHESGGIDLLKAALGDEDRWVRSTAAKSLGKIAECAPEVVIGAGINEYVIQSPEDHDQSTVDMIDALGNLGETAPHVLTNSGCLRDLFKLLSSDNKAIHAADALVYIAQQDPEVLSESACYDRLVRVHKSHPVKGVRCKATIALAHIGLQNVSATSLELLVRVMNGKEEWAYRDGMILRDGVPVLEKLVTTDPDRINHTRCTCNGLTTGQERIHASAQMVEVGDVIGNPERIRIKLFRGGVGRRKAIDAVRMFEQHFCQSPGATFG
ncbi:HEAT repeat domain-containing protein [Salinigranum halophilum]|uniref:HEAT repeat domain-containing protein n=1 Tax=Salinigranum halophilum TaxID=2565931 RepID=UPI00115E52DE|nr:HEAT repeat domain-containing protein [Salinigranum halophilum]